MQPRILHRIWLDDPMPEVFAEFGRQWADSLPGWQVQDWTDPDSLPELANRRLFDAAPDIYPADWKRMQADLLRLELLWHYGGVYVDTDTQPGPDPLDRLSGHACFVGRSPQHIGGDHPLTQAVIGAVPAHPFIGALIDGAEAAVASYRHRSLAQSLGPWHVTRTYRSGVWPDVVTVPADIMYGRHVVHHWNNARRKAGRGLA